MTHSHTHDDHDHSCGSHSGPHNHDIDLNGKSTGFRVALILVIMMNAAMFFLEVGAGHAASSQSLLADALDFLGDTLTYSLTFIVLSRAPIVRARTALFKGLTLVLMSAYVMISTVYQIFVLNLPEAFVMSTVGVLAFCANGLSVLLLYRYRDGDANIRSAWLCSRNDMFGNVAVILAAAGVFGTATAWPDLIVAAVMAGLFMQSAILIVRQAWRELHTLNAV